MRAKEAEHVCPNNVHGSNGCKYILLWHHKMAFNVLMCL